MKSFLLLIVATILCFSSFCQETLVVNPGTHLVLKGKTYLVLNNENLLNKGVFKQTQTGSYLKFSGNSNVSISGDSLQIDKLLLSLQPTASLNINTNLFIDSAIVFNGGNINLGDNHIDLGASGVLVNESEDSRAFTTGSGYLQSVAYLDHPVETDPGNLGAAISSTSNLGNTIIKRGHAVQNVNGLVQSIARYYSISPDNNTNDNAKLKLHYFNKELNGLPEATLSVYNKTSSNNWYAIPAIMKDTVANFFEIAGIDNISFYTIASAASALPITFVHLAITHSEGIVKLKWHAVEQINIKTFQVQKSIDNGINWQNITSVAPVTVAGNFADYNFIDVQQEHQSIYRIAAYDGNGKIVYSNNSVISYAEVSQMALLPNPVKNMATIKIISPVNTRLQLVLQDANGMVVLKDERSLAAGVNTFPIYVSNLASGVYLLTGRWNNTSTTIKLIKN